MKARSRFGDSAAAQIHRHPSLGSRARFGGEFYTECYSPRRMVSVGGVLRPGLIWDDLSHNIVTNEGLALIVDSIFASGGVDPWYVGLLGSSPSPAAGWTKTEVGAADFVAYSEAALQEYIDVHAAAQSTNAASKAAFTVNADTQTIGGAYLASASTKAVEGGAATILCAVAFTGGNKSADTDDVLNVTYTFTAADDGA